jgi:hypothetical protein
MTETQRRFFDLAHQRVSRLEPEVALAVLAVFRTVVASLKDAEIARLIASGAFERITTHILSESLLDRATASLRQQLRRTTETSFRLNVPYLPKAGKIDGTVAVFFDRLNPRVIDALRTLETRVITTLNEDIRETVRQHLARGIEAGAAPRTIAKGLRDVIGLSPRGEQAVANFETMLREGDREALTRLLRDRRFDRTLERAFGPDGKGLTEKQIDSMVSAYRRDRSR